MLHSPGSQTGVDTARFAIESAADDLVASVRSGSPEQVFANLIGALARRLEERSHGYGNPSRDLSRRAAAPTRSCDGSPRRLRRERTCRRESSPSSLQPQITNSNPSRHGIPEG